MAVSKQIAGFLMCICFGLKNCFSAVEHYPNLNFLQSFTKRTLFRFFFAREKHVIRTGEYYPLPEHLAIGPVTPTGEVK